MKNRFRILAALLVLAAGCSAARPAGSRDKGQNNSGPTAVVEGSDKGAEAMKGLRNKLLTSPPEEVGLSGEDAKAKVWGVLMDVSTPAGSATLVSLRDGTASLYTNTGGGILGGYAAREEAKAFVTAAEESLTHMSPTKSFEYPAPGRVKFYVLTRDGVFTAEATWEELLGKEHELSPLFGASHEVLTRLRLATGERKQ
jgi:hypothetical protein